MTRTSRLASIAVAAATLLTACASQAPAPIERKTVQKTEATVVEIQKKTRMVSLRRADGQVVTVELGPEVQNFDQIQVGDRVIASYYEAIGFALMDPKQPTAPGEAAMLAGRALPGERPEAAVGGYVETTVTIESVDNTAHTVTFKGEDGLVRTVPVEKPDGQLFASKLKPGDRVVISYEEAIAISVEPGK